MKKIIFLSFASLFFVAATQAQSADTTANANHKKAWHQKKGDNANSEFYKKLNLSDDQQAQLKAIKQDQKAKISAINSNSSLTAEQKKEQIKAAGKEAYDKRQAIYTPEQKEVIKEDHQNQKNHFKKFKKQKPVADSSAATSGN